MQTRFPFVAPRARPVVTTLAALFLSLAGALAHAEVTVSEAWARATVPQQKAGGAFMTLKASADTRLVAAESPAAATTEIHEMKMEGNVMKMSPIEALELPAGKAVELRPGGHHLMLMQLAEPLQEGSTIPVTLTFEDADGKRSTLEVEVPVKPLTHGTRPGGGGHGHGQGHGH